MTHTIFVTVFEFLNNGGILEPYRAIYNEKFVEIGWFLSEIQTEWNNDIIIIKNNNRSFAMDTNNVFVEIEVKPVYV